MEGTSQPQGTAPSNPSVSRHSGKKSHACGPCRRLKRKCDLQIPCGTCKKGRSPAKVEECLLNPPKPLSNIQELTAPNPKFGRVAKKSPSSSGDSRSGDSPSIKTSPANSGQVVKKQRVDQSPLPSRNSKFGQFEVSDNRANSFSSPGTSPLVQPQPQAPSHRDSIQHIPQPPQQQTHCSPPPPLSQQGHVLLPNQQQPHVPQQPHRGASQVPQPRPQQYQQMPPGMPQQTPMNHSYPLKHEPIEGPPMGRQTLPQPPPPQHFQHHHPQPQPYFDPNENSALKHQLEESFRRIQTMEQERAQHQHEKAQHQHAKAQLLQEKAQQQQRLSALESQLKDKRTKSAASRLNLTSSPSSKTNHRNEYKMKYLKLLPTKIQTKVLTEFYLQNIDYIYHPLHHPSFRRELDQFWQNPEEVDVSWLAILFMVLSLAAIHLPKGLINIESTEIERSYKIWFGAARECVSISDSLRKNPSEFNLYSLQFFSLCQLYVYATKRAEQLNELLQKAVKEAFAMGLDKDDAENPNLLELEMKRRLWWDICGCDTFRALLLGTKPSIRSYHSTVPYPSNCNDEDITPDSIKVNSKNSPTDNSFNIYRAHMMKVLNGVFEKKHHKLKNSYPKLDLIENKMFKGLVEIDIELCESSKGWFFELDKDGNVPYVGDIRIHFQHHMLHTCICIHRFRIYQNYLSEHIPVAWEIGKSVAKATFSVYKKLRAIYDLKNPLFLPQIHQSFTGSVIQSMLLLLNRNVPLADQAALYDDIELMLSDLDVLGKDVFILKPEVLKESFNLLSVMKKNFNKRLFEFEKDQKDIMSNVFGGKDMTENYLKKCTVSFIIDSNSMSDESQDESLEQDLSYDVENQLGMLVNDDLLEKSARRFAEVEELKKQEEQQQVELRAQSQHPEDEETSPHGDRGNESFENPTDQYRNISLPPRAANPPTDSDQYPRANLQTVPSSTHLQHQEEKPQSPQQDQHHHSEQLEHQNTQLFMHGNNHDNHDMNRPFELAFSDVDTFWNDIGQQGLDELNNMYYSEFSGYKIS